MNFFDMSLHQALVSQQKSFLLFAWRCKLLESGQTRVLTPKEKYNHRTYFLQLQFEMFSPQSATTVVWCKLENVLAFSRRVSDTRTNCFRALMKKAKRNTRINYHYRNNNNTNDKTELCVVVLWLTTECKARCIMIQLFFIINGF